MEAQAVATGANLIFVLELFVLASAVGSLVHLFSGVAVLIFVENDAAAQATTKVGPNRPLDLELTGLCWFLATRKSLSI